MLAAETVDMWKIYSRGAKRIEALRGVSVKINKNTITSLLGRNGAGKTTFIRILGTQLLPTKGEAYVLGYDVVREASLVRERIAVLPQEAQPLMFPSPLEYVKYVLVMRGMSLSDAEKQSKSALEEMGIPRRYWNRSVWSLSGGYRRRVLLALLFAMNAELVFLDEPSIGLDPIARRSLWNKILSFRKRGITIILTTHYMEEAYILSDYVIVIHEGKVIGYDTPRNLVENLPVKYKVIVLNDCAELSKLKLDADFTVGSSPPYTLYYKQIENALEISRSLNVKDCNIKIEPVNLEDYLIIKTSG